MYVYKAEKDAGLADVINAQNSLGYYALAFPASVSIEEAQKLLECVDKSKAAKVEQMDLYYMKDILVSTGWNLNDDVFDPEEVWAARHSPEDKQFNFEHKQEDIIGHITGTYAVDEAGKTIADDTEADNLPEKFHIVNSTVLYKILDVPELQERIDKIIAGIEKSKWYVSMECLFKLFDYAMLNTDGSTTVIPRNRTTAHLSKYLRVFGGTGKYEDRRIGRLLRKIVFSGKGLVSNPANPESIIFSKSEDIFKNVGYKVISHNSNRSDVMNEDKLAQLEAQVKLLIEDKTKLEATIQELGSKSVTAKIASLEADLKAKSEAVASFETKLVELSKAVDASKAETKDKTEQLVLAQKQLADEAATRKKAERIKLYASKLEIKEVDAETAVISLVALDDSAFAAHIEHLAATLNAKKPAKTETIPAPAVVIAAPATTIADVLEKVQRTPDVALALANTDSDNVRIDIVKYFGKTEEKK